MAQIPPSSSKKPTPTMKPTGKFRGEVVMIEPEVRIIIPVLESSASRQTHDPDKQNRQKNKQAQGCYNGIHQKGNKALAQARLAVAAFNLVSLPEAPILCFLINSGGFLLIPHHTEAIPAFNGFFPDLLPAIRALLHPFLLHNLNSLPIPFRREGFLNVFVQTTVI
jgi:hypothetical protein